MNDKNYPFEEYWSEVELELVNDISIKWELKEFKPTAGYWFKKDGVFVAGKVTENLKLPEDAQIDEKLWDHEHCELCGSKIMDDDECFRSGYVNNNNWICPKCYEKYILPRRL